MEVITLYNYNYNLNNNSSRNAYPAPWYPPVPNGYYPPQPTREDVKKQQTKKLRRRSNGLGFFTLGYFALFQILAVIGMVVFALSGKDYQNSAGEYLLDIFMSAGAVILPAAIFLAVSDHKLSDGFSKTFVKPGLLVPLVLMGMGVAMVGNIAADIFDSNLSIFGLKNQVSMTADYHLNTLEIILYSVAVSIVPAFAEEFGFRGVLMGSLRKYGNGFAIVTSSIMFGLMHGNSTQMIFAFLVGLMFAYIDVITDSILPSVILHFLNNFYAVTLDMLNSNGSLDDDSLNIIYIAVVLLFIAGAVVSFIYLATTKKEIFKLTDKDMPEDSPASMLTLKEKYKAFFINPGVMISISVFLAEIILNFIPGLTS